MKTLLGFRLLLLCFVVSHTSAFIPTYRGPSSHPSTIMTHESKNTASCAPAVQVATTEEELQQIYRFRYSIYCLELKRDYPEADHEKKWIRDDDDDQDYAVNLYITKDVGNSNEQEIIGAARLLIFQPGQVPQKYSDMFSLVSFPDCENIVISELGRLMVSSSARGGGVFKSLIQGVNETLERSGCQLCFLYCVPALTKYYRQTLNAQPYNAGGLVVGGSSVGVKMVMFVCNRYDVSRIKHLLEGNDMPVELDEEAIWAEAKLHLRGTEGDEHELPPFLASLSEETLRILLRSSLILKMRKGDVITKEGTEEREIYVILEGLFEVQAHRGDKSAKEHIAVLEKGDIFGEIAFFSESGQRSADVEALTDAEVLVLKHSFLKDLTKQNPEASWQILFNLGRVLSERVVETSTALVSSLRRHSMLADSNSSLGETQAKTDKRKLLARAKTVRL